MCVITPRTTKLRGTILVEDRRTERFFRHLLEQFGCDVRRVRVIIAPSGQGSAEAWVLKQYPTEVQYLRSKNYQKLFLLAARDGDGIGVAKRKSEMDEALKEAGKQVRGESEPIALPVPTWSIENWLLALLGESDIDEARESQSLGLQWKILFEQKFGNAEGEALKKAACSWNEIGSEELPSLADGRLEVGRIWT